MLNLSDGRNELWQWDTGRELSVDADCSQVHFSNKVFGRSIDVGVVDGTVLIPDILLQTDKDLYVWAFVGTPENGYTKISKVFKVNRRNKPADYVFTPVDQLTLEEIKEIAESVRADADSGKFNGDKGEPGADGKDYILTEADKTEIAEQAAEMVNVSDNRTIIEGVTVEHLGLIDGVGNKDVQPGKKYAVVMDSTLYVTTCWRDGEGAESFDYIGNPAIALPEAVGTELDTGEPFVGVVFGNTIGFGFADGASHVVSIYNLNELDEALAENAGMGEAFVIQATETGLDKTNAEIYEAFLQNRPMYGCGVIGEQPFVFHPVVISETIAVFSANAGNIAIVVTYDNGELSMETYELGGGGSGGNVDLTGYAKEQWVKENYQPKGNYLTQVPAGYAKTEDIPTKPEDIGAQPYGDYALKSDIPSVPVKSVNGKTGAVKLSASDVGALPSTTPIPSKTSDIENDSGYITDYTETDPTVPAWAKQEQKPSYSKSEVGLGNVDNVKQYSASNPPPYPVISVNSKMGAITLDADDVGARPSDWMPSAENVGAVPTTRKVNGKALSADITLSASDVSARPSTWTPSYSDVGADKSGTASSAVSTHNTKADAHSDIRLLITGLTTRLDALANSDDDTLDQMAEVVSYIKANRDLIDQITTGKVSVADIVNNLTTNVSNKPLSAAQGVALKTLIDAITVPTKLSQLTDDSTHRTVTDTEKSAWNAKSNFSGNYADLSGKPTIPTVPTKVSAFTNDAGYITGYTETDPTVPSWAKAADKPSYSKSEVGLGNVDNVKQYSASNPPPYPVTSVNGKTGAVTLAIPTVPTNVSAFANDAGYITDYTEIDPTVPSWAKAASKPSYTASEVGAVPTTRTVNGKKLSANIMLSAADVGAVSKTQTITVTGVDADGVSHSWTMYGVAQ